jgi:signal peptidase
MNLPFRRPAIASPDGTAPADGAAPVHADGPVVADRTGPGTVRRSTPHRQGLLSRIGGAVLTIVMALALIVFVAMTVLRISGGELLAIRTGSMAPMMEPGDLLISRDVDPRTIRRGDVVTFRVPSADNTLVTHRVTKVTDDGNSFSTKGDANDTADPFTTAAEDVLGIRWFSIPSVGRIMVFLSSGLGTALLIGVPGAIYLGQTLADRRAMRRAIEATTTAVAPAPATAAAPAAGAAAAPPVEVPPTTVEAPAVEPQPVAPGPEPVAPRPEPNPAPPPPAPNWGSAPNWGPVQHAAHGCTPVPCGAPQVVAPQVIVVQLPPMSIPPTFVTAPAMVVPSQPVAPPPYVPVATTPPTPWPATASPPHPTSQPHQPSHPNRSH